MINQEEIDNLLYSVPECVDYTEIVEEIDLEDISQERIEKLLYIINHGFLFDFIQVFRAGGILCHWGVDRGFEYISNLLLNPNHKLVRDDLLVSNDYKYILSAIQSYMVSKIGTSCENDVREKIYPCINKIIFYSKKMNFNISGFYYLAFERFNEYIPLIQDYLSYIINAPEERYWDIHDAAKLLLKLDRSFVEDLFKKNKKKLSDFNLL